MSVESPDVVQGFFYFPLNSQFEKGSVCGMQGKTIRLLRAYYGLSLVQVSSQAGVHHTALSRYERNKSRLSKRNEQRVLEALKELGVSEQDIETFTKVV